MSRAISKLAIWSPQTRKKSFLTVLPHNVSGKTVVDIHNPTQQRLDVEVTVPISTFLAKQTPDGRPIRVRVDKGSTKRIELDN